MVRQNFIGLVVSHGKMSKTIKVRVNNPQFNPRYKMVVNRRKDYLVHDEAEVCRSGDVVRIEATRPISARKHFAVAEIKSNKGQQFDQYANVARLERTFAQLLSDRKIIPEGIKMSEITQEMLGSLNRDGIPTVIEKLSASYEGFWNQFPRDFVKFYFREYRDRRDPEAIVKRDGLVELGSSGDKPAFKPTAEFWGDLRAFRLLQVEPESKVIDDAGVKALAKELKEKYDVDQWPPRLHLSSEVYRERASRLEQKASELVSKLSLSK
ncbi:hypothetical protein V1511DRAFT_491073 [Dipodascopsis uninucleata]